MTMCEIREMLGWCSVINLGLMILMFVLWCAARPLIYKVHGKFTSMSEEKFNQMVYIVLGIYKMLVFVFNIVPWMALSIMG